MRVTVRLFARLRDIAGTAELTFLDRGGRTLVWTHGAGRRAMLRALVGLETGRVAATIGTPPYNVLAPAKGLKVLLWARDYVAIPQNGLIVTDKKIQQSPDPVKRMIKGTIEALQFIKREREESIDIAAKWLQIDRERAKAVLESVFPLFSGDGTMTDVMLQAALDVEDCTPQQHEGPCRKAIDSLIMKRPRIQTGKPEPDCCQRRIIAVHLLRPEIAVAADRRTVGDSHPRWFAATALVGYRQQRHLFSGSIAACVLPRRPRSGPRRRSPRRTLRIPRRGAPGRQSSRSAARPRPTECARRRKHTPVQMTGT